MAVANPWYGDKHIAVMCRRAGSAVKDREAYVVMRDHGLLRQPQVRQPELYQAAKLFELLPNKPNDLWQMDVTYIHIPGYGWWYAVTVLDYYVNAELTGPATFGRPVSGKRFGMLRPPCSNTRKTSPGFTVSQAGSG